ncbi:hypothetical protein [Spirosoma sp. KUDC1026]|uniref:hypothetical protein n=1 Tax=Spirosoma sp. KUDC1026 TaxID=2745947 RepID=UPI00159B9D8A|nr:hypothetical protein [Spirosoma sp. KUDC1026]QKZ12504.1 hypothetical protein HU175_07620 [Spirosoma sp. KUDC1026]
MNIEFIIGTILTIFFGVLSFVQSIKTPPTRLIFVIEEVINLYADITRNISGIDISYKGENVRGNLFLIKAYVFCFGDKDITKNDITKSLYIELDNNAKWKDCKIIRKTTDLDVNVDLSEKKIIFNTDLFKNEDFFCFQSLCDIDENQLSISKIFTINHRIANIGKVNVIKSKEDIVPPYAAIIAWIVTIILVVFVFIPVKDIGNNEDYNFKKDYYLNGKFLG